MQDWEQMTFDLDTWCGKTSMELSAATGEKMPRDADFTDCGLYYRLRELFDNYKLGIMPQAVCTAKKAEYFAEYDQRRLWERIEKQTAERNTKIAVMLTKAVKEGCKHAKDIQDVFCGIG